MLFGRAKSQEVQDLAKAPPWTALGCYGVAVTISVGAIVFWVLPLLVYAWEWWF